MYRFFPFLLSLLLITSCQHKKTDTILSDPEEETGDERYYGICTDSIDINQYTIEPGDNPSSIFQQLGFSAMKADSIYRASQHILDPTKLRVGMHYDVFSRLDSTSTIDYIVFERSLTDFTIIDLTGDSITAYPFTKPIEVKRHYLEGSVSSSLWNAMKEKGVSPLLAIELSSIYAWQIDFFDIKVGDHFKILYDLSYIDDSTCLDLFTVQGAIFHHEGKDYYAIPFEQDSVSTYFDEEGNSLRKAFLKAPMDFFRITSRFTNARFHPVLKRYRAHHGVDYAAPVGTPVKTIGDGVVITKAFQGGGAGNYLKIKHNSTYTTSYMHLKGYAKGIQVGSRVRQGETIGYVGSTGLSTGPHLDFRVYKDGVPINPLKMESPPSIPIKPELKDSFLLLKQRIRNEIEQFKQPEALLSSEGETDNSR